MAVALILIPLAVAALAALVQSNRLRPWLVPFGGALHLLLTWQAVQETEVTGLARLLVLDPVGRIFLAYLSLMFFLCACYAPGYLAQRPERPNRVFCSCLLLTLAMMTMSVLAHHLGLLWVVLGATTLLMAPNVYFNHNARSLEATWKYLLICSVGVSLALLGSFFLAYSSLHAGLETTLLFDDLVREGPQLSRPWVRAAFVLLAIGYGTKMGLAPMHTWKPDTYGEAPGMLGCIMAGGLTNCAFIAILRVYTIVSAAGEGAFAQRVLVFLGLFSMALAAIAMGRQRDIKRMLAYSSVEHMGILVFGLGIGGAAIAGALLHVVTNGLTKGVMFLSAGNLHRIYGVRTVPEIQGTLRRAPFSGGMFLAGFLAITASPPFGPFVSEFQIAGATLAAGHYAMGALFLVCLLVVFLAMGATVIRMSLGPPSTISGPTHIGDRFGTCLPIALFLVLVLVLGVSRPPFLDAWIRQAVVFVEGRG